MAESRKQFEDWAKSRGMSIDFDRHTSSDYDNVFVQCCWDGWQASRAALVVSLPDWSEYDTPRQAIEACEDRLNDAGVSYE